MGRAGREASAAGPMGAATPYQVDGRVVYSDRFLTGMRDVIDAPTWPRRRHKRPKPGPGTAGAAAGRVSLERIGVARVVLSINQT